MRSTPGIVISASHNPFEDNGIKIFSGRGEKLDGAFETRIERWSLIHEMVVSAKRFAVGTIRDLIDDYAAHLRKILSACRSSRRSSDCDRLRATAPRPAIAPALFKESGVRRGRHRRGAERPEHQSGLRFDASAGLQRKVVERSARLGVAFDGDGDRALFVDRRGATVDGDAVLLSQPTTEARGTASGRGRRRDGHEQHRPRARAARPRDRAAADAGGRQIRDGGDDARQLALGGEQSGPHHLRRAPLHGRWHRHRAPGASHHGRDRS